MAAEPPSRRPGPAGRSGPSPATPSRSIPKIFPAEWRSPGSPDDHPGMPGRIVQLGTISTHPNPGDASVALRWNAWSGNVVASRDGPVHAPWRLPFAVAEDRNNPITRYYTKATLVWRSPFVAGGSRGSQLGRGATPELLDDAGGGRPRRPRIATI